MKNKYSVLTLFILTFYLGFSQNNPSDCLGSVVICGDIDLNLDPQGPGAVNDIEDFPNNEPGCLDDGEEKTSWLRIKIDQAGTLAFTITPLTDDDYDFAIYGPNVPCNNIGSPIRCSYADPSVNQVVPTGLNATANDTSEDADGDHFVQQINAASGDEYLILINNFGVDADDGFSISFTGTATFPQNPNDLSNGNLDLTACDTVGDPSDNITSFNFQNNTDAIAGTQNVNVTYYTSFDNAINGNSPLPIQYTNTTSPETIYYRIENVVTGCFLATEPGNFTITVDGAGLPPIKEPEDYNLCDDDTDGFVNGFILNTKDSEALEGLNAGDYTVTYHLSENDATNGTAAIDKDTPYTNTANPQTIYVRGEANNNQSCASSDSFAQFNLIVGSSLTIENPSPYNLCDDDTDGISSEFLLNTKDTEVLNGQNANDFDVTYHLTLADANNGVAAIDKGNPYTNVSNPQTIYVRAIGSSSNSQECASTPSFAQFDLVVDASPSISEPTDYNLCDDDSDGLVAGFILNTKDTEVLNGLNAADYDVTYHLSQTDANAGAASIDKDASYTNISNPQTIYVRGESNSTSQTCNSALTYTTFELIVGTPPSLNNIELTQCDSHNDPSDGISLFNLTENNDQITGGAADVTIAYFETLAQATAGTPSIGNPSAYENTSANQQIFASVTFNETGCSNIATIDLSISGFSANNATLTLCDETDGTQDGSVTFDLTEANDQILDGLSSPSLVVTYYQTTQDALSETNAITSFISQGQEVIYARVEDSQQCYSINEVQLTVSPSLNLTPTEELMICDNDPNATINTSLTDNNLDPNDFSFLWSTGQTTETISINQGGIYTVEVTNSAGCSAIRTITITQSGPATIESILISDSSSNSSVTVNVSGSGDYEFALETDGTLSAYQDNSTFDNVSYGLHTVFVSDKGGCLPITTEDIWVLGFPEYFTPNGDGFHEAWNVLGLPPQSTARSAIYIFNRHGKLLKQLEPQDSGWDGTYNGQKLPSSEYWFKVELANGRVKTGSFSLIR